MPFRHSCHFQDCVDIVEAEKGEEGRGGEKRRGEKRGRESWDSFKITSVLISFSPLLYKSSALHRTLYPEHSPVMSWHEGWDRLVLHLWQAVEAGQVI